MQREDYYSLPFTDTIPIQISIFKKKQTLSYFQSNVQVMFFPPNFINILYIDVIWRDSILFLNHKCFAHQTPNAMIHTLLSHIFRPLQDLPYLAHSRIPTSICEYGKLCKSCSIALEKSEICVTHY